jgi:hypothetical protein
MGKSSTTSYTTPQLTQEQKDQIKAQTEFFTGTIKPTYENAVRGATDIYNWASPGVLNAAQNQAAVARQLQSALGSTGESALRTGISGLQTLFDPNYEANQIQAALAPAQAQYLQNAANQAAMFGGAGQMGSARQALADRQLAGATQAAQMQTAAQVQRDIAAQRANVGSTLAQLGQGGLGQALGAAGNAVSASMIPQQLYNQYASVIFGTPATSYNPDFRGTQGSKVDSTTTKLNFGVDIPGVGKIGGGV